MRCLNPVRLFVVLSAIATAGGLFAAAQSNGMQPLDGSLLSQIRGSAPGDCTGKFLNIPCSESLAPSQQCFQWDGNQGACDQDKLCVGCNNASGTNQYCSGLGPWNSLCDPTISPSISDGCGKHYVNPKCRWTAMPNRCRCFSESVSTYDCPRHAATEQLGPCIVVLNP